MPKVNCAGGRWPYPHLLPSLHLHKVELDPESPTTANHHVLDGRLGRRFPTSLTLPLPSICVPPISAHPARSP